MRPVRLVCCLAALVAASVPATAQPVAPEACAYDVCALRVEPGFFGFRLLRGVSNEPVGHLGLFGSDLSEAVGTSERALEHARVYEDARGTGLLAVLGGGALIILSAPGGPLGDSEGTRTAALIGGAALSVVGARLQIRSQQALSRAVWEYNRDLAR